MDKELANRVLVPKWAETLSVERKIPRREEILNDILAQRERAEASSFFGSIVPSSGARTSADFELKLFRFAESNDIDFEQNDWRHQALAKAAASFFALNAPKKKGRPLEHSANRLILPVLGGPGKKLRSRAEKILAVCRTENISQKEACLRQARADNPGLNEIEIIPKAKQYQDQVSAVKRITGNRKKLGGSRSKRQY